MRLVQLQGLEAHVISQLIQEGKEPLLSRFALCHPPLTKAPPLFYPEAIAEEAHGSPAESEVLHGNQQRQLMAKKAKKLDSACIKAGF
ncbi:hypothetical protein BHE18_21240 [Rossellomorea aquimaris]|uniref:Uncharacterized protein n=1 Tax=Rossellomorea aquimaris TaxID=189382 RepID=A0A1J6W509_9BACI|nr:hypothetical protein BHE18_21240 [Rossellomorea aquimaris]